MTKYCLNEFDNRGYGNEYEVDKLDRSTFEIATIPDIFDMYSLNVQNRNVEKTIQKWYNLLGGDIMEDTKIFDVDSLNDKLIEDTLHEVYNSLRDRL